MQLCLQLRNALLFAVAVTVMWEWSAPWSLYSQEVGLTLLRFLRFSCWVLIPSTYSSFSLNNKNNNLTPHILLPFSLSWLHQTTSVLSIPPLSPAAQPGSAQLAYKNSRRGCLLCWHRLAPLGAARRGWGAALGKVPSRWVTSSSSHQESTSTAESCASGGFLQAPPMLEKKKIRKQGAIKSIKGFIL